VPAFQYKKLVRDNIWGWHIERGHEVDGKKLTGFELRKALCEKLHEEADEVDAAQSHEELVEEIADVRQILDDLCAEESISEHDIATAQKAKFKRKGGFREGNYIDTVTMKDENDKWVLYCRKSPEKYPEIRR
jgi:predicted house-cleaning noncanonical NTP pyrophosphatase (MazG superfamily)